MDKKFERSEGFCSHRCRSVEHADEIAAAILRGNELQAISFMCWRCSNYSRVTDEAGRTALHIASSCGKTKVLEWILMNLNNESGINAKDYESGYTPLHRSIFHGQLHAARCLIKHGAKLTALDNDGLAPLDHLMKDWPSLGTSSTTVPCEVFVWGSNRNFNLGIGNNESRRLPDTIDYFRRSNISITQVSMGKFHSVFISSDGRAFSCGHGKGRLGLNSEETIMTPNQIALPSIHEAGKVLDSRYAVVSASVGQDHTLLLTSKGIVYTFGINTHYQLGLDPPPQVQHTPKPLHNIHTSLIGIKAARYHSVAWSCSQIYTWGSNHGQLGHSRDEKWVLTAKLVHTLKGGKIVTVAVGDNATVIGTSRGDVYVLQYYLFHKIGNMRGIPRRIAVIGGRLDPTLIKSEDVSGWGDYRSGEDELYVLMLNETKKLMIWWSSSGHFTKCYLHMGSRLINANDIALGTDKLLVVTDDGEGFETEFKVKKRHEDSLSSASQQTTLQKLVDKDKSLDFQMKKIMSIHRANSVYCCPKGLNFSIVQHHPSYLVKRPEAGIIQSLEVSLSFLLEDADEADCISDVVFSVHDVRIPAHRYILESTSKCLASLINSAEKMQVSSLKQGSTEVNGNVCPKKQTCVIVNVEGINPVIFKDMLRFLYTGMCEMCMPDKWSCEKDNEYACFASHMKGTSWKVSPKVCDDDNKEHVVSESLATEKVAKGRFRRRSSSGESESNPVVDARRAAARFGLDVLAKQLDGLQYNKAKCSIQRRASMSSSLDEMVSKVLLNPYSCTHLYDVVIECDGEKIINAHKCVLAMRSKYFETMFKGDWIECSGLKNITLPFSYDVMQAIISYLYQNKVPALNKSDDLSYICNVLITADQILLEGLKETCEILLVNHITLKNVSEFYQISDTYNAIKLKQFCLEYMCINLSALLESRALDDIDPELFDDLQLQYWGTRTEVLQRYISIPSKYPDLSTLQSIFEVIGMPTEEEHLYHSESALRKEAIEVSKRSRAKRKQRSRPTSVDEKLGNLSRLSLGSNSGVESELNSKICDTSLAEHEICELFDGIVHISGQDDLGKDIRHPTEERSWVKNDPVPVPQEHSPSLETGAQKKMTTVCDEDFPMLSSDVHHSSVSTLSKTPKNRKMTKISQKERKKQQTTSSMKKSAENGDSICKPEVNPWGRLNRNLQEGSPVQYESPSLSEIMDEERRRRPPRRLHYEETSYEEHRSQRPAMRSLSMECSPSPPPVDGGRSGGWPTTPPSAEQQAMGPKSFDEIIADEIKQREMTKKMLEKPLNLTLIEDRAIKDLQTFYDREHEHDERITVRRMTSAQASKPVWPNSKK